MPKINFSAPRLAASVEWKCAIDRSCDKWIGVCDELGLTVQADHQKELHVAIWEAMEALFTILIEENELENFLSERGWDKGSVDLPQVENFSVNIRVQEEEFERAVA